MWRSIQLEPSSSLARGGMLSAIGGGGTPEPPNQEDISLALDELERGLPDTSRCGSACECSCWMPLIAIDAQAPTAFVLFHNSPCPSQGQPGRTPVGAGGRGVTPAHAVAAPQQVLSGASPCRASGAASWTPCRAVRAACAAWLQLGLRCGHAVPVLYPHLPCYAPSCVCRYAEWRRDVRWAMYNKRVRIATEMFSELFGSDFDSIIPIYPTGEASLSALRALPPCSFWGTILGFVPMHPLFLLSAAEPPPRSLRGQAGTQVGRQAGGAGAAAGKCSVSLACCCPKPSRCAPAQSAAVYHPGALLVGVQEGVRSRAGQPPSLCTSAPAAAGAEGDAAPQGQARGQAEAAHCSAVQGGGVAAGGCVVGCVARLGWVSKLGEGTGRWGGIWAGCWPAFGLLPLPPSCAISSSSPPPSCPQSDIAAERDAVLSDLPSTCFFATFKSQQAAAIAAQVSARGAGFGGLQRGVCDSRGWGWLLEAGQPGNILGAALGGRGPLCRPALIPAPPTCPTAMQTNHNPIKQRLFKVMPAPRPDDVNWPALQRSWWQRTVRRAGGGRHQAARAAQQARPTVRMSRRLHVACAPPPPLQIRPLYALPIILFFMLLPIGMFTGAFAQVGPGPGGGAEAAAAGCPGRPGRLHATCPSCRQHAMSPPA